MEEFIMLFRELPYDQFQVLRNSNVYGECLDKLFSIFCKVIKFERNVLVSSSMSSFDAQLPVMAVRQFSVRFGGSILCSLSNYFDDVHNQEGIDIIDSLSVHLEELDEIDNTLFLRTFNRGFLRFPVNELISFIHKVYHFFFFVCQSL